MAAPEARAGRRTLQLGKDLALPLGVVTERLAFLGMSGGGKTYAAMKLAELMLEAGAQVVALDPVGPWWGLRAAADGKRPGFPIHVFGGMHGDFPLIPEKGALVADLLVEKGISAVLDVSDFTLGQMARFVSDLAERFFERKKRSPTPIHLFLEEAHNFIPQNLPPGGRGDKTGVMMHRLDRIVRVGRNYGIGSSLISQQPQSVNKKALNQARTVLAFASGGVHERKAIVDWFGSNTRAEAGALSEQLRSLELGYAYFASTWLKVDGRQVRIAPKVTFDSSKTPEFGAELPVPKVLAPVDRDWIRDAMAEVVAEAERDDPHALRRRIAELERELKDAPARHAPAGPPRIERVEVPVPVLEAAQLERLEGVAGDMRGVVEAMRASSDALAAVAKELAAAIARARTSTAARAPPTPRAEPRPPPIRAVTTRRHAAATASAAAPERRRPADETAAPLKKGQREMLAALAGAGEGGLDRTTLAVRSCMRQTSGSFSDYLSNLHARGLAEKGSDGRERITAEGRSVAPTPRRPTAEEIVAAWGERHLKLGQRRMLEALLATEHGLSREDLAEAVGMAATSGSFSDYLSNLHASGLVTKDGRTVRLSPSVRS
jgi:hypothetical protein